MEEADLVPALQHHVKTSRHRPPLQTVMMVEFCRYMKLFRMAVEVAALGAAPCSCGGPTRAAHWSTLPCSPASKLSGKADVMTRTVYFPLREIRRAMNLPFTDSVALETLTVRSGNNRSVVTKNSALISY